MSLIWWEISMLAGGDAALRLKQCEKYVNISITQGHPRVNLKLIPVALLLMLPLFGETPQFKPQQLRWWAGGRGRAERPTIVAGEHMVKELWQS